jgi:hypothetical protein
LDSIKERGLQYYPLCVYLLKTLQLSIITFLSLGLDDNCLDAVLGDGIHGQTLQDNICYKELSSQTDLRKAVQNENFIVSSKKVFIFMESHNYGFSIT